MELIEIQKLANEAYGDQTLSQYYDEETGHHVADFFGGDFLALFIATEIDETFEEGMTKEEQLWNAAMYLRLGRNALEKVINSLCEAADNENKEQLVNDPMKKEDAERHGR